MKKLFSVVLAISLLVSCTVLQASAEDTITTVALVGEAHAVIGAEYKLYLNVTEPSVDTIGGLSCGIKYNTEMFTLNRVEIASDFASANRIKADSESAFIKDDGEGTISVVLLDVNGDQADNKWLTLVFDVKDVTESTATFSFAANTVTASDANGTTLVTTGQSVVIGGSEDNESAITPYSTHNSVNGASIRKDASGNIRFEAEIPSEIKQEDIDELGFLMLPTAFLNNGDLTLTDEYADSDKEQTYPLYTMANGKKISIGHTKAAIIDKLVDGSKFYCYLTNTTDYPLNMEFSARPYVKLKDGTVIYAYNDDADKNITSGTSSKSCMSIAKAIYELYKNNNNYSFESDVVDIINSDSVWDVEQYKKVVSALADCADTFQ